MSLVLFLSTKKTQLFCYVFLNYVNRVFTLEYMYSISTFELFYCKVNESLIFKT